MSLLRTLQRATTSQGRMCIWLLWAATLTPATSFGQINDLDGVWQGTLACSEALAPPGRPGSPSFTSPLTVTVSMGAMTARRENARIFEIYKGSIQRTGHASLEAVGQRKVAPANPWRLRLQGPQTGNAMALRGPLESADGKVKWRDCKLVLALTTPTPRVQAAEAARPTTTTTKPALPTAVPAPRNQPLPPVKAATPPTPPTEEPQAAARHQAEAAAAAKALEQEAARTAANQAAADRAAAEKMAADKAAAEKAATEKAAVEKAATEKAAAEKAAAEKRATDGKKAPIRVRSTMDL